MLKSSRFYWRNRVVPRAAATRTHAAMTQSRKSDVAEVDRAVFHCSVARAADSRANCPGSTREQCSARRLREMALVRLHVLIPLQRPNTCKIRGWRGARSARAMCLLMLLRGCAHSASRRPQPLIRFPTTSSRAPSRSATRGLHLATSSPHGTASSVFWDAVRWARCIARTTYVSATLLR